LEYKEILHFCIENLECDDDLYPMLCHNLSGVYRRSQNFEKALSYSNLGIKSCHQNKNIRALSVLYYGKGISEYKLDQTKYIESLNTSITLAKAFGQNEIENTIVNNCKNIFNIDPELFTTI